MASFAIKVDLDKACDNISWNFINNAMSEVKVLDNLKDLIMLVVTSVRMGVLRKGDKCEFFEARKGLRQGEPLSSYLFIICMENSLT